MTEDWSNDAENSALDHRNKLYFKLHSNRKLFQNEIIFQNITVSNTCSLGEHKLHKA